MGTWELGNRGTGDMPYAKTDILLSMRTLHRGHNVISYAGVCVEGVGEPDVDSIEHASHKQRWRQGIKTTCIYSVYIVYIEYIRVYIVCI
jgi:hypothetical protein